jgi:hypothetical protein
MAKKQSEEQTRKPNYARHTETNELVFFAGELPDWDIELEQWAFHAVPLGSNPVKFNGRIIGEDSESRCQRMRHAPKSKACSVCSEKECAPRTYHNHG